MSTNDYSLRVSDLIAQLQALPQNAELFTFTPAREAKVSGHLFYLEQDKEDPEAKVYIQIGFP